MNVLVLSKRARLYPRPSVMDSTVLCAVHGAQERGFSLGNFDKLNLDELLSESRMIRITRILGSLRLTL